MFSKTWQKIIGLVISSFLLAACSASVSDVPPNVKNPEFKAGDKVKCLVNVLPVMSGFVEGSARPQEVEAMWECFRAAIDIYSTYVRGRQENLYTPREVATFFEVYFLGQDLKINDQLLVEIMRLKQIFVGGSDQHITRQELQLLTGFAQDMKVLSLRLLPYMKVYSLHWKISQVRNLDVDIDYFENANLTIQEAAKDFAALISKNNQSYTISNFSVLLEQVSNLYHERWSFIDTFQKALPLVYKLKKTLSGGDEGIVASNEWRRFTLLGARGYVQYLRYYYFMKTKEQSSGGEELVYIAKSFDDLFSYLGDMVAEKPEGVFTRGELYDVLKALTQFVPDVKVSEALLLEVMKVKRVLFGGDLDNFTPKDFTNARSKVESFRFLTEKFLNYLPFYGFEWRNIGLSYDAKQSYFDESEANLIEITKGLGDLTESEYDLKDLSILAQELDQLYPREPDQGTWLELAKKYLPSAIAGRQILFSDNLSVIQAKQWKPLLKVIGQGLGRYYYYYYFIQPKGITYNQGDGLKSFQNLVEGSVNVLDQLIDQKPKQLIPFSDLDKLTNSLLQAGFLPSFFDSKAINNLVRVVFQKFLVRPSRRLNLSNGKPKDPILGLSHEATKVLRDEAHVWLDGQKFFEKLYQGIEPGTGIATKRIMDALKRAGQTLPFNEFQAIFESPQSRSFDSVGRLVIAGREFPSTADSANNVNLARQMSRWIIRSYALDLKRINSAKLSDSGINGAEGNQLYQDVKPFLVALGLVEEKNTSFATSRFLESNLFTPRGNGDDQVNFIELSDLVLHILSGLKLDNLVRVQLDNPDPAAGCLRIGTQNEDAKKISVQCFADTYRRQLDSIFGSMPTMRTYLSKLVRCRLITGQPWISSSQLRAEASDGDKQKSGEEDLEAYVQACEGSFDSMILNMLKAAGYVPEKQGLVKLGETSLVPHVMQYIESFMQRYDRNSDGIIDRTEMLVAYPTLKNILSSVSGYTDDTTLRALLAYFMINGRPPESAVEKGYFYIFFRFQEDQWDVKADRSKMAAILGFIADSIRTSATNIIGREPKKTN